MQCTCGNQRKLQCPPVSLLVSCCFESSQPKDYNTSGQGTNINPSPSYSAKSHQTAKMFKTHNSSLDTNVKQNLHMHTSNTNFRRNSPSYITLAKKTQKAKT